MILLEQWLAALRSGEYKQGRICLYDQMSDSYCCLGVGCKLAGLPVMSGAGADQTICYPISMFLSDLPPEMLNRQNSVRVDGVSPLGDRVDWMNDAQGSTFPEIADAIESTARRLGWRPTAERQEQ